MTGTAAVYENLKNISVGNMILIVAGLIPGAWTAFLVVDSWGRKPIQLLGFVMLTILYIIMGASRYLAFLSARRACTNHATFRRVRIREAHRDVCRA